MSTREVVINVLSSLLLAAMVAVPMALLGAPAWASFGVGAVVYFTTVSKGRRRA